VEVLILFRCESAALRNTLGARRDGPMLRGRSVGFGVHRGVVDGVGLCRMFNRATAMPHPRHTQLGPWILVSVPRDGSAIAFLDGGKRYKVHGPTEVCRRGWHRVARLNIRQSPTHPRRRGCTPSPRWPRYVVHHDEHPVCLRSAADSHRNRSDHRLSFARPRT